MESAASNLEGRIALVTGAGRGIGRGIAQALVQRGATVIINDIDSKRAERCARELGNGAIPLSGDVSTSQTVDELFELIEERTGGVDILVNNAGVDRALRITEIDENEWDRVLTINLKSVFLCTKAALPSMIQRRRGRVISLGSIVARQGAMNGGIHYASSKAAILGFTKTLARQHAKDGITANAVAPGVIDTDLIAENMAADTRKSIENAIPLGELGTIDDVGQLVAFLASDAARYITGATVDVNGGFWMG